MPFARRAWGVAGVRPSERVRGAERGWGLAGARPWERVRGPRREQNYRTCPKPSEACSTFALKAEAIPGKQPRAVEAEKESQGKKRCGCRFRDDGHVEPVIAAGIGDEGLGSGVRINAIKRAAAIQGVKIAIGREIHSGEYVAAKQPHGGDVAGREAEPVKRGTVLRTVTGKKNCVGI